MRHTANRRHFVATATASTLGLAPASLLRPHVACAAGTRIRVGQIGTAHAHAGGKMETLRKLAEVFEVVGIVEADASRRERAAKNKTYDGLRWMT